MKEVATEILYEPSDEALRFLPEGPYRCPDGRLSWVAIQHGPDARVGSLNLLDLDSGTNQTIRLPGRPGFAFPTDRDGVFVIGMERQVVLFDVADGTSTILADHIDAHTTETVINDGLVFHDHLIFGCKDPKFQTPKAGLYLLRSGESHPIALRTDQVCSNGKAVVSDAVGATRLFDICSHSQQVKAWDLDISGGRLDNPRVVVDLTSEEVFPDGMLLTPDAKSLIIAIYDPREVQTGQARQYEIATGELTTIWTCERSPRVTCPQLIQRGERIELVLTTADEGMSPEHRATCPHAGCMFTGATDFIDLNDAPLFRCVKPAR